MPKDVFPTPADQVGWGAVPCGRDWAFSIWAPASATVMVQINGRSVPMVRDDGGYFRARLPAKDGEAYSFVVDGAEVPDPASRRQVAGVHDASCLVDAGRYAWQSHWHGRPWHEAVIYELHIGTFTEFGTFRAAMARLADLAELGFTAIEIMPVAQFAGQRGWGYDGVLLFAPHNAYGTPDDLRAFVEAAQALGMMVILDVVYNHFGSEGNYLPDAFFDEDRHTPWGRGIDYSQPAVRQYFVENAMMWLRDYRLDGLRLDAVHQIAGPGAAEFLVELARTLRSLDLGRPIHLITEDERNLPDLRDTGLYDAEWNDDYHHAIHVLLTKEAHGYYAPFAADPMADLVRALSEGQVRQGQDRGDDGPPGGPSAHLPWTAFVNANQTHDQIGNRPQGDRLISIADPAAVETAMALLLLAPFIPQVFMGEEHGETAPFLFFADYSGELAEIVQKGRIAELANISAVLSDGQDPPDPCAPSTFRASRLTEPTTEQAIRWRTLMRRLLTLRRDHVVPLLASGRGSAAKVVRTGPQSLTARWPFTAGTLILHVNLGSVPATDPGTKGALFALKDVRTDPFALSLQVCL